MKDLLSLRLGVLLGALAVVAPAASLAASASGPPSSSAAPDHPWCGTGESPRSLALQRSRFGLLGSCAPYGSCDDPSVRDGTHVRWINLRTIVHVFRRADGTGGPPPGTVQSTIDQINADLRATRSGFRLDVVAVRIHDDDFFHCIPPCDASGCDQAFGAMDLMRQTFAEAPEFHCNVYISCMSDNAFAGVGSFPFFDGTTYFSGFWLNSVTGIGAGNHIPVHELGHTLGLWHTFHGVEEVGGCSSPCTELASGFEGDLRGDFAGDTPATTRNFSCAPPSGTDCEGTPWGPTQVENFMGYSPSSCQSLFTPNQIHRMQCWTQEVMPTWASTPIAPCERPLDASTVSLWHLSEGSGASTADAGSALTATLDGGPAWGLSACGSSAIQFSQPTHALRLPTAAADGALAAGTLECTLQWSGAVPAADGAWIVDQSAGAGSSNLGVVLRPDGHLGVHVAGAERLVSDAAIVPLRWTRVAVNWDGSRIQLYLDDILDGEAVSTAVPAALAADFWFAHSGGTVAGAGAFDGALDEIRMSRVARVVSAPVAVTASELRLAVSPNPAPGRADLAFSLPRPSSVRVELFDFAGRRVATVHDGSLAAGTHRLRWSGRRDDGSRVAAGIYVARIQAGDESDQRTLVWMP